MVATFARDEGVLVRPAGSGHHHFAAADTVTDAETDKIADALTKALRRYELEK